MSQWKMGQLLACGNSLEKPGRAAGKSFPSRFPDLRALGPVRWPQPSGSPRSKRLRRAHGLTSLPYAAPTWEMLFLCLAAPCAPQAAKCRGRAMSQRASRLDLSARCMEYIAGECT